MNHKLIRDLKRLGATLGASGSIIGVALGTGAMANGYLPLKCFATYIMLLVIVALISICYINQNTEEGEWIED